MYIPMHSKAYVLFMYIKACMYAKSKVYDGQLTHLNPKLRIIHTHVLSSNPQTAPVKTFTSHKIFRDLCKCTPHRPTPLQCHNLINLLKFSFQQNSLPTCLASGLPTLSELWYDACEKFRQSTVCWQTFTHTEVYSLGL